VHKIIKSLPNSEIKLIFQQALKFRFPWCLARLLAGYFFIRRSFPLQSLEFMEISSARLTLALILSSRQTHPWFNKSNLTNYSYSSAGRGVERIYSCAAARSVLVRSL
jgi:hypothetical protein